MRAIAGTTSRLELLAGAACGLGSGLVLLLVWIEPVGRQAALVPLDSAGAEVVLDLVVAMLLGAALALLVPDRPNVAPVLAIGLLVGLAWWTFGSLTLSPLLQGDDPSWTIETAAAAFPSLVSDLFFGGLTGLLLALATHRLPARAEQPAPAPGPQIVILGGGFGGVATAQKLERIYARDPSIQITLVSESNYLLFTPMLAEVASSALEAQHISAPVRASCPRTRFRRADVEEIDVDKRSVRIRSGAARFETLEYDHLVLALGSVPSYRGLPGLAENAFPLKSLEDATVLRNHVIAQLEQADAEDDPVERKRLLTFVVVGGGFAGTESAAELLDLAYEVLRYYPHVPADELRFVLVHSGERILPELSAELGAYAQHKLEGRGLEFVLHTRVARAAGDKIELADGRSIPTRTLVWTAGNQPSPLLAALPCERSRAGAVCTDTFLRVPGLTGVWAIGDCAQVPDPDTEGGSYPPTAQHALRQGKVLAQNIAATIGGRAPKEFRFRTIGLLVGLGHRTAAAEIRGRRFSGLFAWMMWRGIYWSKLPGAEKKLRVAFDWTVDLLFPRDIVLTGSGRPRRSDESDIDA